MLRVIRHPNGPRVYVLGQRVHHGATGCVVVAAGVLARKRAILAAGILLTAHDRHDWRAWWAREIFSKVA